MLTKMTEEDIIILKKAINLEKNSLLMNLVILSITFILSIYASYEEEMFFKYPIIKYLFYFLPILVIICLIARFFNTLIDFNKNKKDIIVNLCKLVIHSDDVTTYELIIENYGIINLVGYNSKFKDCFTDKFEEYELHITPRSKIILKVVPR